MSQAANTMYSGSRLTRAASSMKTASTVRPPSSRPMSLAKERVATLKSVAFHAVTESRAGPTKVARHSSGTPERSTPLVAKPALTMVSAPSAWARVALPRGFSAAPAPA
jgi:hypothetical protein